LAKETKNSSVFEEKKEAQAQQSSHTRFGLRSHAKKYKEFCETERTKKTQRNQQEVFENSFMLFQNIKNHLKQDSSKSIYVSEAGQVVKIPDATEHVQLNRMVWPEHMDNTLKTKIQTGVPLTGRPINKEKVTFPGLDKVVEEVISVTHTQNPNTNRTMPPQTQQPPTNMPQGPPSQIPQTMQQPPHTQMPNMTTMASSQLPVANSPHLIPNQMTPTGTNFNPNMNRYVPPNQGQPGPMPGHMRPAGGMHPGGPQPNLIPNQHTPTDMYEGNPQPMGHRPGPGPMQRGYPNMPPQGYPNPSGGPMNPKMMPNTGGPMEGRSYPPQYYNMPNNSPGNMPSGGNTGNMPGGMQGNVPMNMSGNMQPNMNNMPGGMPNNMQPMNMPNNMGGNMPQNMNSNMPPNMGGNMPQNMNSSMPPNMGGNPQMQGNVPMGMHGNMNPNMNPNMNNMPNNMQNNMPMGQHHMNPNMQQQPKMQGGQPYPMKYQPGPGGPGRVMGPGGPGMQNAGPMPNALHSPGQSSMSGPMPNMGMQNMGMQNMGPGGGMPPNVGGNMPPMNMVDRNKQQQKPANKK